MATITFTNSGGDNLWSNAANWDSGVPADDDSVVIPVSLTCIFDVDTSGFATGIAGITVTGTLSLTRTAGTYHMKMKAATTIAGAGTFDCGTSVSPIPFAAKHTITGGAAWYVNGAAGLTMTVYAAEPETNRVRLSALEATGQTILSIDTDISGESNYWKAGDEVRIHKLGSNTVYHDTTIASVTDTTITVNDALIADYAEGSFILLLSRNVKFISNGTTSQYLVSGMQAGKFASYGGQYFLATRGFGSSTLIDLREGVWYCTPATSFTVSTSFSRIDGCVFSNTGYIFSRPNVVASNIFSIGGTQPLSGSANTKLFDCSFYSPTNVIVNGGAIFANCIMGDAITADVRSSSITAYNTVFSTLDVIDYATMHKEVYSESINHNAIGGNFKAWTKGGVTTRSTSVYPTGYTQSYEIALEDADNEGYWQREIGVPAGESVKLTSYLRKSAAMSYLPRVLIFDKAGTDPFAGGTPDHTFTMTDSTDTWEDDTYTYSNDTTQAKTLVIRVQGKNATGTVNSWVQVESINVDLTDTLASLALIQAVTDQFVFTVANQVDANALTGGTSAVEIRQEMDANSTQLAAIVEDIGDVPSDVWDEILTGATHNIPTSAGRRLRQIASTLILEGEVVSSTNNTITFDGEASTVDGAYDPALIYIVSGIGAGQSRMILAYDGATKTAVVDRDWKVNPDDTSEYAIVSHPGREHVNEGLIRGATEFTAQLNDLASTDDGAYVGLVLFIRSGTGQDQARRITGYDGATQTITTRKAWDNIPDTTSAYVLLPTAELDVDKLYAGIWNNARKVNRT